MRLRSIPVSRGFQVALLVAGVAIGATCSGTSGKSKAKQPKSSAAAACPDCSQKATGLTQPNQPPGFEFPAYQRIGVGQEIGFGLEVVDHEADVVKVELIGKPDSALFDPYTLTVIWKPTRKDIPAGHFSVRITEKQRASGETRIFVKDFSIEVTRNKQQLPTAQPLGPAVETLITIHDPNRLAQVNRDWPIDKLLEHGAKLYIAALPDKERDAAATPDKKALYLSYLKTLADANDNPRVDPSAGEFDRDSFGNPRDWKIITLRPRLDKNWMELRIVYKAKAHEATYAMFKFRLVIANATKPGQREVNNKEFSRLTLEAFFSKNGTLDESLFRDKRAHAKRTALFMKSILEYKNDAYEWATATFLGIPSESRLGGGSIKTANGLYESGDGWAWNVAKLHIEGGVVTAYNSPIKGFATAVAPSADGKTWDMKCAPIFDPNSDDFNKLFEGLCRDSGHVDLPGSGNGYGDGERGGPIVSARKDAVNMFVNFKNEQSAEHLPARDPRRDLFEEKGMTCSQCHVRRFGVRDMRDKTAYDPSAGEPTNQNKSQATTYFVIVPTERWQPYAIDFQEKQECKFKVAIKRWTGIDTSLTCPLDVK